MTTPLERRDWFVNAAARRAQAAGVPVSTDALQRQAAADLILLDNVRAAGFLVEKRDQKKKTPEEVIAAKKSVKAEAQAKKIGGRVRRRSIPVKDSARGRVVTGVDAQRIHAMAMRLRAIGARAKSIRNGQDMEAAFQYPALARSASEAVFNHGAKRGEYAGKSKADRDRILTRQLEDVCDKSNAVFGVGWWVPK